MAPVGGQPLAYKGTNKRIKSSESRIHKIHSSLLKKRLILQLITICIYNHTSYTRLKKPGLLLKNLEQKSKPINCLPITNMLFIQYMQSVSVCSKYLMPL